MKRAFYAIAALVALAAPVGATEWGNTSMGGAFSNSATGGMAVTFGGAGNGTSVVETSQYAQNQSGALANGDFGSTVVETFSTGGQGSMITTSNVGYGTTGFGGGFGTSAGGASAGGFFDTYNW